MKVLAIWAILANMAHMKATKTDLKNKLGELLRAAFSDPVVITDHGKPSHVLLTIEHYKEMMQKIEEIEKESKD